MEVSELRPEVLLMIPGPSLLCGPESTVMDDKRDPYCDTVSGNRLRQPLERSPLRICICFQLVHRIRPDRIFQELVDQMYTCAPASQRHRSLKMKDSHTETSEQIMVI